MESKTCDVCGYFLCGSDIFESEMTAEDICFRCKKERDKVKEPERTKQLL